MLIRYSEWRDEDHKSQMTFQDMMRLFSQLLVQNDGDVGRALQWLTYLDNKHDIFNDAKEGGVGDFIEWLKEQGYIEEIDEKLRLTGKGSRQIRKASLDQIFKSLRKSPQGGQHGISHSGEGIEKLSETKPYRFGDSPANIDFTTTINNAIKRHGLDDININEDDLEIYETEHLTNCATVLMIDISHSMILYGEDRITPAKNSRSGTF